MKKVETKSARLRNTSHCEMSDTRKTRACLVGRAAASASTAIAGGPSHRASIARAAIVPRGA